MHILFRIKIPSPRLPLPHEVKWSGEKYRLKWYNLFNMKQAFNLTSLSRKFGESYVALDTKTNKVVAHARRADKLVEQIKDTKKFKEDKLIISWVPKYGAQYVFRISPLLRKS